MIIFLYFAAKSSPLRVIAKAVGPWRSPGAMSDIALLIDEWHKELATLLSLLAMTV